MRKTWVSSVVAGLLVLAPIAAVAQSGGQEAQETGEVEGVAEAQGTSEEEQGTETLELVAETETDEVDVEDGEDPAGDSNDHGERVSAVARCAPTGQLDIVGFANHGAFVRAVAHGDTVTVEDTEYDLSTAEGVEALCAWAESYEPPTEETVEAASTEGQTREDAGRPDHAGPPADAGKPDHARGASRGGGEGKGPKGR